MHTMTAAAAALAGTGQVSPAPSPKLVNAAHEFEAQMMKELLKPMTSSDGLEGEDDNSASGSGGALEEFASEAFAQALSKQGGFGIATSIIRELTPKGDKKTSASVTGNLHGDTVLKLHE
jgi:Rod binding domain-containing protein